MTYPKAPAGKVRLTIGYYDRGRIDSAVYHLECDSVEAAEEMAEEEMANLRELGQKIWFVTAYDEYGAKTVIIPMGLI